MSYDQELESVTGRCNDVRLCDIDVQTQPESTNLLFGDESEDKGETENPSVHSDEDTPLNKDYLGLLHEGCLSVEDWDSSSTTSDSSLDRSAPGSVDITYATSPQSTLRTGTEKFGTSRQTSTPDHQVSAYLNVLNRIRETSKVYMQKLEERQLAIRDNSVQLSNTPGAVDISAPQFRRIALLPARRSSIPPAQRAKVVQPIPTPIIIGFLCCWYPTHGYYDVARIRHMRAGRIRETWAPLL